MNDLQIFNYQDTPVRTAEFNGEPAIVLTDIAKVLGYRDANTAGRLLRDHHKGYAEVRTPGGTQKMTVVTEKGFNRLVMRSNAKNAEDVQDWITDEVLPEIRKTGGYGQVEQSFEEMTLEVLTGLQAMVAAKDETIAELEPKARAWDHIVSSEASWSFNDAAKFLFEHKKIVVGEKRLFNRCEAWGYLYRDSKKRPHAYQRSVEQGLFVQRARFYTDQETGETRESSAPQVRVTGKGLDAIFRRLTDGQLEIAL